MELAASKAIPFNVAAMTIDALQDTIFPAMLAHPRACIGTSISQARQFQCNAFNLTWQLHFVTFIIRSSPSPFGKD
jgi:hypothetical protein